MCHFSSCSDKGMFMCLLVLLLYTVIGVLYVQSGYKKESVLRNFRGKTSLSYSNALPTTNNIAQAPISPPATTIHQVKISSVTRNQLLQMKDGVRYGYSGYDPVTSAPSRDTHKTRIRGDYVVRYNAFNATRIFAYNNSVTLATQCTVDYLHHLNNLVKRWEGPISVAVYTPGWDYFTVNTTINNLRNCNSAIANRVTFHLFYHTNFPPRPYPGSDSSTTKKTCDKNAIFVSSANLYVRKRFLRYPIATARNIARIGAETFFILTMDIEFLPSVNLMSRFSAMVEQTRTEQDHRKRKKIAYVLPVFELKGNATIPSTKRQLVEMLRTKQAIVFHEYKCWNCQRFQGIENWGNFSSSGVHAIRICICLIVYSV